MHHVFLAWYLFRSMQCIMQTIHCRADNLFYCYINSKCLFLFYMIKHPGEWLIMFALWNCCLEFLPQVVISTRAYHLFPECRFSTKYISGWSNIKKLTNYTFWITIGSLGYMLRSQGVAIVVNKCYGAIMNASLSIGTSLSGHTNVLSSNLLGAFSPALYNAYGAGDIVLARRIALRMCKLGVLMMLVFALLLTIEVEEVLELWLKNPPEYRNLLHINYCSQCNR